MLIRVSDAPPDLRSIQNRLTSNIGRQMRVRKQSCRWSAETEGMREIVKYLAMICMPEWVPNATSNGKGVFGSSLPRSLQ